MAAPLPVGLGVLADLILRPAEEPPLHHDFNKVRGIPATGLVACEMAAKVPGFRAVEADIEVPCELRAQWRSLGATVPECIAAFFNGSTSSGASAFFVGVPLPGGFARDLACGGRLAWPASL
jgi:hypothetical protein